MENEELDIILNQVALKLANNLWEIFLVAETFEIIRTNGSYSM